MRRRAVAVASVAAIVCASACGAVVGPDLATTPAALFDRLWSDIDAHYSLFIVKQVNWDSLRTVYRPDAAAAANQFELEAAIIAMLGNLHDGHVQFMGRSVGPSKYGGAFLPTVTYGRYVVYVAGLPSGISYGSVSSKIGYIQIPTFESATLVTDLDQALAALGAVTSIIIDVRNNDGGLLENATSAASRFAEHNTTVAYVRYRDGPAHTDFTGEIAQTVQPSGPRQFRGSVYVLVNRNTVSAAELFVMSMHALGRSTVVGDTTAGETGSPFARELQNGWSYQFPESIEYTINGNTFEDVGLPPDQPLQNTQAQIQRNIDAQMQRAITLASQAP